MHPRRTVKSSSVSAPCIYSPPWMCSILCSHTEQISSGDLGANSVLQSRHSHQFLVTRPPLLLSLPTTIKCAQTASSFITHLLFWLRVPMQLPQQYKTEL